MANCYLAREHFDIAVFYHISHLDVNGLRTSSSSLSPDPLASITVEEAEAKEVAVGEVGKGAEILLRLKQPRL